MDSYSKTDLVKKTIQCVYIVASRRTSSRFADDTIKSSIDALKNRYDFLEGVRLYNEVPEESEDYVSFSSTSIEQLTSENIGKAIESFIRLVYEELSEEAGLYFITEFKEYAGKNFTRAIYNYGVDLDQIQLEQHHAYERRERKKKLKQGGSTENLLGYNWEKVSAWHHEEGSKYCTLYDEQGKVLDRLNLDRIIQNYVETLSGETTTDPEKLEKEVRIFEKEYNLLKLMLKGDMEADTAIKMLDITRDDLNTMIKKLSKMEMVQYVTTDTIELTDTGITYLNSQQKE